MAFNKNNFFLIFEISVSYSNILILVENGNKSKNDSSNNAPVYWKSKVFVLKLI